MKRTIADILLHFFTTVVLSVFIYHKTDNLIYAGAIIAGGIFLDLDHLIDHFLYYKNKFNLVDFLNCSSLKSGKVYLFFHSWEIALIIFSLALIFNSNVLLFFSLGLLTHLLIDSPQRQKTFFYFFIYRYSKKFEVNVLMPELKREII